jgi:hypothetical protein
MSAAAELRSEERLGRGPVGVATEILVHFSEPVAALFNGIGRTAKNLGPGEFVPMQPGEHQCLAIPLEPLPKAEGMARYRRLRVSIDGDLVIPVDDHPRFFSFRPEDPSLFRGGPTWVRTSMFPEGFLGRRHSVSAFEGDRQIWETDDRLFASRTSSIVYHSIADGKGKLVAEVSGLSERSLTAERRVARTLMALHSAPVFGLPTAAVQIDEDGTRHQLTYQVIGVDYVGDTHFFNEGVLWDLQPTPGRKQIEISFPQSGAGYASIMSGGYSAPGATRADATVR